MTIQTAKRYLSSTAYFPINMAIIPRATSCSTRPGSENGCGLFVKQRRYPQRDQSRVTIYWNQAAWQSQDIDGVEVLPLYNGADHPQIIRFARVRQGVKSPKHNYPCGEEVFVIDGALQDKFG